MADDADDTKSTLPLRPSPAPTIFSITPVRVLTDGLVKGVAVCGEGRRKALQWCDLHSSGTLCLSPSSPIWQCQEEDSEEEVHQVIAIPVERKGSQSSSSGGLALQPHPTRLLEASGANRDTLEVATTSRREASLLIVTSQRLIWMPAANESDEAFRDVRLVECQPMSQPLRMEGAVTHSLCAALPFCSPSSPQPRFAIIVAMYDEASQTTSVLWSELQQSTGNDASKRAVECSNSNHNALPRNISPPRVLFTCRDRLASLLWDPLTLRIITIPLLPRASVQVFSWRRECMITSEFQSGGLSWSVLKYGAAATCAALLVRDEVWVGTVRGCVIVLHPFPPSDPSYEPNCLPVDGLPLTWQQPALANRSVCFMALRAGGEEVWGLREGDGTLHVWHSISRELMRCITLPSTGCRVPLPVLCAVWAKEEIHWWPAATAAAKPKDDTPLDARNEGRFNRLREDRIAYATPYRFDDKSLSGYNRHISGGRELKELLLFLHQPLTVGVTHTDSPISADVRLSDLGLSERSLKLAVVIREKLEEYAHLVRVMLPVTGQQQPESLVTTLEEVLSSHREQSRALETVLAAVQSVQSRQGVLPIASELEDALRWLDAQDLQPEQEDVEPLLTSTAPIFASLAPIPKDDFDTSSHSSSTSRVASATRHDDGGGSHLAAAVLSHEQDLRAAREAALEEGLELERQQRIEVEEELVALTAQNTALKEWIGAAEEREELLKKSLAAAQRSAEVGAEASRDLFRLHSQQSGTRKTVDRLTAEIEELRHVEGAYGRSLEDVARLEKEVAALQHKEEIAECAMDSFRGVVNAAMVELDSLRRRCRGSSVEREVTQSCHTYSQRLENQKGYLHSLREELRSSSVRETV